MSLRKHRTMGDDNFEELLLRLEFEPGVNAQNVKRMRIILPAAWKMAAVESTTASEVQVSLLTRFTIFGQFQARFPLRGLDFSFKTLVLYVDNRWICPDFEH